jgi:exodeoxyribonuclease V alpha subunit
LAQPLNKPADKPLENVRLFEEDGAGQEVLQGALERITYQNPDNGFLIGRLAREKERDTLTIKGRLPGVREGETLKVWGSWEEHRTYGPQFAVTSFLVLEPTSLEGIERYLINNVKGVGEKLAHRIVRIFGHDTFQVIDETPEKLLEVPKFPRKALQGLKADWQEQRVKREILVYLHSVGISQHFAERIFALYGLGAVDAVKENPYRLAMEVQGIGFRTADQIAARQGFAPDAPQRVEAGLLYTLDEANAEGHTGYPRPELIARCARLLEVAPEVAIQAVDTLVADGLLKPLEVPGDPAPAELLFRSRFHRAEEAIARELARIDRGEAYTRFKDVTRTMAQLERESGLYLGEEQRAAVEAALAHKLLVITGGPGTGKTTIIRFILGLVAGTVPALALAAPTGKAAKRLAEATGRSASTIHRLLEAGPRGFGRTEERPIDAELVIIDESSMIDTLLMEALLAAIPAHARLVLVGDVDQLPSVGPGRVLGDLIASGCLPVVRLETVFRQSAASRITANAHAIRKGILPNLARPDGEGLTDFYFLPEAEPARIVEKIRTMVMERIPERFGFDPRSEVQVLTPMHRGLTGALHLNRMLQEWLNPKGAEVPYGEQPYRVGDKVMQTRNDYEKDVFNGDMGAIQAYDADAGLLRIDFDGRDVIYERKGLENLTLGYAITVHKAQGSEYPAVVLPLTTQHAIMLQRNLLYTAITRGRRLVVVIGTERAVALAVHNARPVVRHTGLRTRLAGRMAPAAAG